MKTDRRSVIEKTVEEVGIKREDYSVYAPFDNLRKCIRCRPHQRQSSYFQNAVEGDPRINLQKLKGNLAKPYQVRQVLPGLRKLIEIKNEQEK